MNGLLRSISSGVVAFAVAGAGLPNVLVAQAATNALPVITSVVLTPDSANEGDTVRLDVTFTDPDADVVLVTVGWGEGAPNTVVFTRGERSFFMTHTYGDDSPSNTNVDTRQVTVDIEDGVNPAAQGGGTVTLRNVAPVVTAFSVTPATILKDQSATAEGSFVDPSRGDTYTLLLDWGDGSAKTQMTLGLSVRRFSVPHTYLVGGTFTVTATVTDDDTGVGGATAPIAVTSLNTAPSDLVVTAGRAVEGGTTTLTANFVDPDAADTHTASLDWGDGTAPQSLALDAGVTSFSPTYVYPDSGSYNATVTVSDGTASTAPLAVVVDVANVGPTVTTVNLSASSIVEGESVTVEATFADPGMSDTFTLTMDWGDGTSWSTDVAAGARSASASHQYLAAGPFSITVTVTDRDSAAGSMTRALDVRARNRAPTGLVLAASSPTEGAPATLTGSFTDLDATDTHRVTVTWGDGTTATLPLGADAASFSATHTYANRGTYHVNVTVTDAAGLAASAAVDVVVQKRSVDKKQCDQLMALEQRLFHYQWANSPYLRRLFERASAILNAHFGCDDDDRGGNDDQTARHSGSNTHSAKAPTNDASAKARPKADLSGRSDR